jgi:hypothetical protein
MPQGDFERELQLADGGEPYDAAPGSSLARRFRPNAALVTQLMAIRLDAPQTRARRRAGDAEAVAAYGAAGEKIRTGRRRPGASWAV